MNLRPQYVTDKSGKRVAVILDLSSYERILEDWEDLKTISKRKREHSIPFSQFEARLKKRDLL